MFIISKLFLTFSIFLGSQAQAETSCQKNRTLPPPPANLLNVSLIGAKDDGVQKRFIPAVSTTRDGRIGVSKVSNNIESGQGGITIVLLKPELEKGKFHTAPQGKPLAMIDYDNLDKVIKTVSISKLQSEFPGVIPTNSLMHSTICEVSTNHPLYNSSLGFDEYLFNVVSFEPQTDHSDLKVWTFEFKVRVKNPKSTNAYISQVLFTGKHGMKVFNNLKVGLEPSITADGKFMIVRTPLKYSYNPTPCDPEGWSEPQSLTKAHSDPKLKNRDGSYKYGLLKYPFRDSMGNNFSSIDGGYPWLDREGNNLFFLSLNRTIGRSDDSRLSFKCTNGGSGCDISEPQGSFRGMTVIGLWTHGKAVLIDGMLNNADYPATALSHQQKTIMAYQGNSGIPISGNRFNSRLRDRKYTGFAFANLSVTESLETKFNYNSTLAPSTPRDVVWKVTRGVATDEVVFDEYVDPNYLIFSEMVGAVENADGTYFDGFQDRKSKGCYNGQVRVQNAATSYKYASNVPAYGYLKKNNQGRIEPVALGGIRGKGLHLTTENGLIYDLNKQVTPSFPAHFSTFFDLRSSEKNQWYSLVKTPSGAEVQIHLNNKNELNKFRIIKGANKKFFSFKTPLSTQNWFHLAIVEREKKLWFIVNGNEQVKVKRSGLELDLLGHKDKKTKIQIGLPGHEAKGFSGWIDDVRLIANAIVYKTNPEMACNMARGTILKRKRGNKKSAMISRYNLSGHKNLFCHTDYQFKNFEIATGLGNLNKSEFKMVREKFLLRHDQIVFDQSRPDTTENQFCLTCHTDKGDSYRPDSLKVIALEPFSIRADEDRRRQPLQPSNHWNGYLPKNYFKSFNKNQRGPASVVTDCGKKGDFCNIDELLYD